MSESIQTGIDFDALFRRASLAATPEACEACLEEIARWLESTSASFDQARLIMCRARVRSNQWRTREVCEDAVAAMTLFEGAGAAELAIDAASLGAAHASRLGELSLALELATKSLLGLDSVNDDRLRCEISNRLGIFCYSFFDYDRAVEQMEESLAAAERIGDVEKVCRQLQNIADALLLASRQHRKLSPGDEGQLERAESLMRRLMREGTAEMNRRFGSHRLLVEILCDSGSVEDALQLIDELRDQESAIVSAPQRAALAQAEARCLRLAGRGEAAVAAARRAVQMAEASNDEAELMLALEELATCEAAAGDFEHAVYDALEVKGHMWAIHQRQTRELVQQLWARVDLERDHRSLLTKATEATRSAEEDVLTGIGNRRVLERFLDGEEVRQSNVACIIADIDSFKEINDTFGHDIGDTVLRQVGHLFASKVRSGEQVVRYGGDEFVMALSGVDLEAARGLAERLRRAVCKIDWEPVARGLQVTVSFGVACGPANGWRDAFADADGRLLAAKRQGRNTVIAISLDSLTA